MNAAPHQFFHILKLVNFEHFCSALPTCAVMRNQCRMHLRGQMRQDRQVAEGLATVRTPALPSEIQ